MKNTWLDEDVEVELEVLLDQMQLHLDALDELQRKFETLLEQLGNDE